MSVEANFSDLESRRVEAAYLYEQAGDILLRMEKVYEDLDPEREVASEQEYRADKADALARQVQEKLGVGLDVPSETTLSEVRELVRDAMNHANEAEPAFPSR